MTLRLCVSARPWVKWLVELDFGGFVPILLCPGNDDHPHYHCLSGRDQIDQSSAGTEGNLRECTGLLCDLTKLSAAGSVVSVIVLYFIRGVLFSRLHLNADVYIYIFAGLLVMAWWTPLVAAMLQGAQRFHLLVSDRRTWSHRLCSRPDRLICQVFRVGAFPVL